MRISKADERRLLARLSEQAQDAPNTPNPTTTTPRAKAPRKKAASASRRCIECDALVGKGRKADTCSVCDMIAAIRRYAPLVEPPEREVLFARPRRWRFDLCWPSLMVAVEVDGGQYVANGGRHATDADREKLNNAAALGWLVLRFSPQQVTSDPATCVALIVKAMGT